MRRRASGAVHLAGGLNKSGAMSGALGSIAEFSGQAEPDLKKLQKYPIVLRKFVELLKFSISGTV